MEASGSDTASIPKDATLCVEPKSCDSTLAKNAEATPSNAGKSSQQDVKPDYAQVQALMNEPGVARVKLEYLDLNHKKTYDTKYLPKDAVEEIEMLAKQGAGERPNSSEGPPKKKVKLKGRNKHRPVEKRPDDADRLCPSVIQERECHYGERCRFSHDVKGFLERKPKDIGDSCYIFENYGRCPYGLACRFATQHLTENYENVINHEQFERSKANVTTSNVLGKELQIQLRKRQYKFDKADVFIRTLNQKGKLQGGVARGKHDSKATNAVIDNPRETLVSSTSQELATGSECKTNTQMQEDATGDPKQLDGDSVSKLGTSFSKAGLGPDVNKESGASEVLQGADTQVTSEVLQGADTQVASEVLQGTDTQVASEVLQGADTQVTSEVLQGADTQVASEVLQGTDTEVRGHSGVVTDEDVIKLRPEEKKKINFCDKVYLAPLTTCGNLPFRRVCKQYGVDITCGEMALATNLLQGQQSEWALLKRHQSEDIFGVQICGGFPDSMSRCAQLLTDHTDVDFIDINCGCPIDLVFKKGEGCALLGRTSRLTQIVRGMKSVMDIPLTVKMRTGVFEDKNVAHSLIPTLRDVGVDLFTLHGRSREQRYTKLADWDYINKCAQVASPVPLFGNGDILSFEDANRQREATGVSGLMVARGALIKPWVFTEIKEQRHWDISANERLDMLKDFCNYGLEHWGSDQQGVETTRRFLLEWLSFLHRYIPVGVLEQVPQKINERPPYYLGRSDLETLLSSPNCGDWIKISEMLLGPVPPSFMFLPKHKANAYK